MNDRWGTGRIEAFSDGVFAIAITLLVLEIGVPARDFDNLWKGIADQWPSYLGYATSFLTVGGLWLVHHGIFRRMASADAMVMRLNILLLMLVSFLPFPTKLVAEAIDLTSAERAAVIFYGLVLLAISVVTGALWRYVAAHRDLLEPGVTDEDVTAMTLLTAPSMGFYVGVVLLALIAPRVAAFGYLAIAVVAVFRTRRQHRRIRARLITRATSSRDEHAQTRGHRATAASASRDWALRVPWSTQRSATAFALGASAWRGED